MEDDASLMLTELVNGDATISDIPVVRVFIRRGSSNDLPLMLVFVLILFFIVLIAAVITAIPTYKDEGTGRYI